MPFTGQNVIDAAHALLADINTYWQDIYLLSWLNSGLKEVAIYKPNAHVITASVQCQPGTKQVLPAGGLMPIDISRNMGVNGTAPGKVITPLSRQSLDSSNPDWHTTAPSAVAKHFVYDPRYPKMYYVYPPQPATGMGYIELTYGATPESLTDLSGTIWLDSIFENILVDYIVYRAYGRDSTDPASAAASKSHYDAFTTALGVRVQTELAMAPVMPVGSKAR
jgi:hypothetical protein